MDVKVDIVYEFTTAEKLEQFKKMKLDFSYVLALAILSIAMSETDFEYIILVDADVLEVSFKDTSKDFRIEIGQVLKQFDIQAIRIILNDILGLNVGENDIQKIQIYLNKYLATILTDTFDFEYRKNQDYNMLCIIAKLINSRLEDQNKQRDLLQHTVVLITRLFIEIINQLNNKDILKRMFNKRLDYNNLKKILSDW